MYSRADLRPITVIRAVHWLAFVATTWSLGKRWGDELAVGKGPPDQWERHVVGAALLLLVAALAISFTARNSEKPGTAALVLSLGGSLGALALSMSLRSKALDHEQAYLLVGGGWLWMTAGGCIALGAGTSALALLVRPKELEVATASSSTTARGAHSHKKSGSTAKKKKKRR